jgi:hypothetical protein
VYSAERAAGDEITGESVKDFHQESEKSTILVFDYRQESHTSRVLFARG